MQLKAAGQLRDGKPSTAGDRSPRVMLSGIDVTKDESARDQKIAKLDGDAFERLIARCRAYAEFARCAG